MVGISSTISIGSMLFIILFQLLSLTLGLSLPLPEDVCTASSLCVTNATSTNTTTSYGPLDFDVSYTDFHIIFSNFGRPIPDQDAAECVHTGLVGIELEIYTHWTQSDIPIARDLVFRSGPAELRINAAQRMYRTYCLMLILGILEWGRSYEFVEANMVFKKYNGGQISTLGTGSFRLLDPAS